MEVTMGEKKYPAIKPKFLSGDKPLLDTEGKQVAQLVDYWSWAHSDLIGNTERGGLAEYIVACALGIQKKERVAWDKYDLLSEEGIAVEVKASGYIQTWEQEKLSNITFGIQPTFGWNSETNVYDTEQKRQSEIYVFCIHKHTDQGTINPLDISQWEFYILPTAVLNEKVGEQKHISLGSLLKIGAAKCEYGELHSRIVNVCKKEGAW